MNTPDDVALFRPESMLRTRIANAHVFLVIVKIEGVEVDALFAVDESNAQHLAPPHLQRLSGDWLQRDVFPLDAVFRHFRYSFEGSYRRV